MTTVLLVIHIMIAIAMVGMILLQKNEGGGPGIGGGTMGGLMSTRGTANLLTRTTAVLATLFFLSTLGLAIIFKGGNKSESILDTPAATVPVAPMDSKRETLPVSSAPSVASTAQTVPVEKDVRKEKRNDVSGRPSSSSDKENK